MRNELVFIDLDSLRANIVLTMLDSLLSKLDMV